MKRRPFLLALRYRPAGRLLLVEPVLAEQAESAQR